MLLELRSATCRDRGQGSNVYICALDLCHLLMLSLQLWTQLKTCKIQVTMVQIEVTLKFEKLK